MMLPSSISYGASSLSFSPKIASTPVAPTSAGGSVVSWSINPALPAGLTFSTTDGSISGTPSAPSATVNYVVTAQNSGGQSTVSLKIAVGPNAVIDLGHQTEIQTLRASATRLLSADQAGHWYLWDYSAATVIASGVGTVDMAGSTLIVQTPTGLDVRAVSDGHTTVTIPTTTISWWKLATDGSYVTAGNASGLSAWTIDGTLLFSLAGDYSQAIAFATPATILVARSPAGQSVVQSIAVPAGTTSLSAAFNGTFNSWFTDGSAFTTTAGNTSTISAFVYSVSGVQQRGFANLPTGATIGGRGNWVWTYPNAGTTGPTLNIYPPTGSAPATASFVVSSAETIIPSDDTLALIDRSTVGGISIVDLSGSTPTRTDYIAPITLPGEAIPVGAPFAAVSASQWVVGNPDGLVLDGTSIGHTPRYFGYGQATSVAGGSSYFAVATASGTLLYFDSNTLALAGKINFNSVKLALSTNGSVLAAMSPPTTTGAGALNIYALPTGGLQYAWPEARDLALAGSGSVLAQDVFSATSLLYTQEAAPTTGGSLIFSTSFNSGANIVPQPRLRISPDGSLVVTSEIGTPPPRWAGCPLHSCLKPVAQRSPGHHAGAIYDATGTPTGATCALPELLQFQPISSDLVYDPGSNEILSVSTGAISWASGDALVANQSAVYTYGAELAAIAGSNVVFLSGSSILAQPY